MLGLQSVGKTTILYRMEYGASMPPTSPTKSFNHAQISFMNYSFLIWDIGGELRNRNNWKLYVRACKALIYVVDSSDREGVNTSRE